MDVISMARELGKELQKDERIIRVNMASQANDDDEILCEMIDQFNSMRVEINQEVMKAEKDQDKIATMDAQFKSLYADIMARPTMVEFSTAKEEADGVLAFVMQIINASVNGEDPDTIKEEEACSGSCSSCKGCH